MFCVVEMFWKFTFWRCYVYASVKSSTLVWNIMFDSVEQYDHMINKIKWCCFAATPAPKNISAYLPRPSVFGSRTFLEKVLQIHPPTPSLIPPPSPLFLPFSSPIILFIVMLMDSAVRDQNATNLIDEKEITERSQRRGGRRGRGVCIHQPWMIFLHWSLME